MLKVKSIIDQIFNAENAYDDLLVTLKFLLPVNQLVVACSGEYKDAKVMNDLDNQTDSDQLAKELALISNRCEEELFSTLEDMFKMTEYLKQLFKSSIYKFGLKTSVKVNGVHKPLIILLGSNSHQIELMMSK